MTFAPMGGIKGSYELASFYADGKLSIPMYVRSLHINKANYDTACSAVIAAFEKKGLTCSTALPPSSPTPRCTCLTTTC